MKLRAVIRISSALFLLLSAYPGICATLYVSGRNGKDSKNGLSWSDAKASIQSAVDASSPGDSIIVTNGIYKSVCTYGRKLKISSVNGAEVTIIDGNKKTRCATLAEGTNTSRTIVSGFTLRKGLTDKNGGGALGGTLRNCIITGNNAVNGGGASESVLVNCRITKNHASESGGGVFHGKAVNCEISYNSATTGSGIRGTKISGCSFKENTLDIKRFESVSAIPQDNAVQAEKPARSSNAVRGPPSATRWDRGNLIRHWNKHGAEFPEYNSADAYGNAALAFFNAPPSGTMTKTRGNGDTLFYDPESNCFGVITSGGVPKTFFRPDNGIAYWRRQ